MAQAAALGAAGDNKIGLGIGIASLSMFCYAVMESASKLLTAGYHPTQILLFRIVVALVIVAVLARNRGGWSVVRSARPGLQALRSGLGCASMMASIFAYSVLPLADVLAVVYSAPILVTLLSVPILGEVVGVRRSVAAGVGFLGVLLVVQPGRALTDPMVALPLVGMVCYAVAVTLTRKVGRSDRSVTTLLYTQLAFLVICLPFQPFVWVTPSGGDLALFAVVAASGALAQLFLTLAYSSSPPAMIAPFDYTTIFWATLLGFAIWGHVPGTQSLVGMAIIVMSGVYIALRELSLGRKRTRAAQISIR